MRALAIGSWRLWGWRGGQGIHTEHCCGNPLKRDHLEKRNGDRKIINMDLMEIRGRGMNRIKVTLLFPRKIEAGVEQVQGLSRGSSYVFC